MIDKIYQRNPGESDELLLYRIYSEREDGTNHLSCDEAGELMNELTGNEYTESRYRKQYQSFKRLLDEVKPKIFDRDYLDKIEEKQFEFEKQKVKAMDRLRVMRSDVRKEARYEELTDAVKTNAKEYPPLIRSFKGIKDGTKEAVLLIGDFHIGNFVDNFKNVYNLQVATERLAKLQDYVIKYCTLNNVKTLHVLGLGDFIHGTIHVNARIEADLNAVEQVKAAAILIYNLLMNLSEYIEVVDYRQCLDNHSRLNADYEQHIEAENMGNFIAWWLLAKLAGTSVKFYQDNIDENIGQVEVAGKKYAFVHGHLDSKNSVLQDLVFGTNVMFEGVFVGHFHVDKTKNFNGHKVYFNGSLVGTDSFALNHRLFGDPSQKLLIFDDKNVIDIPINLGN